jgi:hypothetical protein
MLTDWTEIADVDNGGARHLLSPRRRSPQHEGSPGEYTLSLAVFIPISGWMADR